MPESHQDRHPVVLIVRDGWGENPHPDQHRINAIHLAQAPISDQLGTDWPTTLIRTCGEDVGLPPGTMGNSEVGHQNIGAGRIVDQELIRITRSVQNGTFLENEALISAFDHASRGGKLHLMGLLSNGKVHSDIEHLFALLDMAARQKFPADRLFVHAFMDGRDTGPALGMSFVEQLEQKLAETGRGRIASVIGRYFAMDRDHRWPRVELAYLCLTGRRGDLESRAAPSALEAVRHYYEHPAEASRTGDEFILPTRIIEPGTGNPVGLIEDNDAVIFFNFRGDRPREITRAFTCTDEEWADVPGGGFDRGERLSNLRFCTMCRYEQGLRVDAIAFPKPAALPDILGQTVQDAGLTQFRCAETEKFPHVTFFFNDYREQPFDGERRLLVPSPREVTTYDQQPAMSASAVCDGVLKRLNDEACEALLVVNFANPDMVGHTGKLDAVIEAVEVVDVCVGRIVEATLARGGSLIITADHGNAEQMWDSANDCPHTAHTTFDVPLHIVGEAWREATLTEGGRLADIAPTLLAMMGIEVPAAMTGRVLLSPRLDPSTPSHPGTTPRHAT